MKRPLDSRVRTAAIAVAAVVAIGSLGMFLRCAMLPATSVADSPLFDYKMKSAIGYEVSLKPSPLFPYDSVGPGGTYYQKLVNSIHVTLTSAMETGGAEPLVGEFQAKGTLVAYDSTGKDALPIFQKEYQLLAPEDFESSEGKVQVERELDLDPAAYEAVLQTLTDFTEVRPARTVLNVEWVGQYRRSDGTLVGKPLLANMIVPVNARYFKIDGNLIADGDGTFTVKTQGPSKASSQKPVWAVCFSLSLLLGGLVLYATEPSRPDQKGKALSTFMAKYGSRIAKSCAAEAPGAEVVALESLEDLAKVADELGKPMIMLSGPEEEKPIILYVVDNGVRYQHAVQGK